MTKRLPHLGRSTGERIVFQRADDPDWVACGRFHGSTVDGLIMAYPWEPRHSAIDPARLKIGRWVNLRMNSAPDRDITAEIERVERIPDDPSDTCYYHLRFRNYGWDDGPGSAPRTAPLLPRSGDSDAHASPGP